MSSKLLLAPAAGGKTQAVIDRITALLRAEPLSAVWVIVPDRVQGRSLEGRLAKIGVLGVRVGIFRDLHEEILAEAGKPFPVTPEPVIHLLLREAIERVAERGQLRHYEPIRQKPGLVTVLAALFAELKRSLIKPEDFSAKVRGREPRLGELAALYEEYQNKLVHLNWSDHEGLGWLALEVLGSNSKAAGRWPFLVVDGFDSFNPCQIALLKALEPRVGEMLLTLTGDLAMSRPAYRRFARTLADLQSNLAVECKELPARPNPVRALAHLESDLFRPDASRERTGHNVTFVEAQDTALEAREALRWLKARIVRDGVPADQCALVAGDIGPYSVSLREAAREFGLPLHLAVGEPLTANPAVAALLSLLELPLQNWARRPLLDVLRTPYFDLSAFGFSRGDASLMEEAARAGLVIGGIDQWREALLEAAGEVEPSLVEAEDEDERPPQRPVGRKAAELWERLRLFYERLTPPANASLADYAHWIEELIGGRNGVQLVNRIAGREDASERIREDTKECDKEDTRERDQAAIQSFAGALSAIVLGEAVVGRRASRGYAAFYAELRAVVDAADYRVDELVDANKGQIYAASLPKARGVCYRAVALLGLSEGLLPAQVREDPLLSDEDRDDLAKVGLQLEPRLRSDQQTLFYEGVTRSTEHLFLSRPYLADDGEIWEESPYWTAALSLCVAKPTRVRLEDLRSHEDAASAAELFAWSVRRRALPGEYVSRWSEEWETLRALGAVLRARLDAGVTVEYEVDAAVLRPRLAARYGSAHVWSASRLESYAACPFQFYTSVALGLEERTPPQEGYDAAQLGSLLHELLEAVYLQAGDRTSLDDLLATLSNVAPAIFEAAPRKHGFRTTPLWESQQHELLKSLARTLAGLVAEGGAFQPAHFERQFGLGGEPPLAVETGEGPVLFRGVIDRVDIDLAGNLRIIDYKTGSAGLGTRDLIEGKRLQLAIYSLAAASGLRPGIPVDGFYWSILSGKTSQLRLQNFNYLDRDGIVYLGASGAIELAVKHIARFLRGLREGVFTPVPPSGGCKEYCPARRFCWRYQSAGW